MADAVSPKEAELRKIAEVSIQVFQHDWIPGFAAFHPDGELAIGAPAHVVLNLGSLIAAVHTGDLDKRDLPYMIAESLMHEVVHVLESWANVEFSEDRVEELLAKYRAKYSRATIWEYTGAEPKEATEGPGEKFIKEANELLRNLDAEIPYETLSAELLPGAVAIVGDALKLAFEAGERKERERWIPAFKLPEVGGTYLVVSRREYPATQPYQVDFGHFFLLETGPQWSGRDNRSLSVVYWREFPKLPAEVIRGGESTT